MQASWAFRISHCKSEPSILQLSSPLWPRTDTCRRWPLLLCTSVVMTENTLFSSPLLVPAGKPLCHFRMCVGLEVWRWCHNTEFLCFCSCLGFSWTGQGHCLTYLDWLNNCTWSVSFQIIIRTLKKGQLKWIPNHQGGVVLKLKAGNWKDHFRSCPLYVHAVFYYV